MENVRKRANDPSKFVCCISIASYKHSPVINEDLALVEDFHAKAVLSKPIAVGCIILEFAKLVMYEFYYDCLLPTVGDQVHLCFTDTDSFIRHIKSEEEPHRQARCHRGPLAGYFEFRA